MGKSNLMLSLQLLFSMAVFHGIAIAVWLLWELKVIGKVELGKFCSLTAVISSPKAKAHIQLICGLIGRYPSSMFPPSTFCLSVSQHFQITSPDFFFQNHY